MTDIFNNRELAIIVWLTLIIFIFSFKNGVLKSYFELLKAFFQDKIISSVLISIIYVEIIILFLALLNYWKPDFLKETIFWFLGSAFLLMLNSRKALENKSYFKKIFRDSFKLIILLEFITNFYSFNLFWELIIIPFISSIVILDIVAGYKNEYRAVKILTQSILSIIGITLFIFAINQISIKHGEFINVYTAKIFLLPIFLTILYLPFLYLYVLYMKYENLYLRIGFRFDKNDPVFKTIKKRIFFECILSLRKLEKLENTKSINYILDYEDFNKTINEFRRKNPVANNV